MSGSRQVDEAVVAGAMLGTFLGDALGARWEGSRTASSWEEGSERVAGSEGQRELAYTDDTQMMLALARHLLDEPRVDPEGLRARFVEEYEPWRGYGGGAHAIFDAWSRGASLDEAARAAFRDGSFGNGGAMRIAPVGVQWAHEPELRREAAVRSARVTHVHPLGVEGAVLQAEAVAYAAVHGSFDADAFEVLADVAEEAEFETAMEDVADLLTTVARPTPREVADRLGVDVTAHRSVPAAWWIAATADDPREAAALAFALGGDADTIGAMSFAVLGAAHGATVVAGGVGRHARGRRTRPHRVPHARAPSQ